MGGGGGGGVCVALFKGRGRAFFRAPPLGLIPPSCSPAPETRLHFVTLTRRIAPSRLRPRHDAGHPARALPPALRGGEAAPPDDDQVLPERLRPVPAVPPPSPPALSHPLPSGARAG